MASWAPAWGEQRSGEGVLARLSRPSAITPAAPGLAAMLPSLADLAWLDLQRLDLSISNLQAPCWLSAAGAPEAGGTWVHELALMALLHRDLGGSALCLTFHVLWRFSTPGEQAAKELGLQRLQEVTSSANNRNTETEGFDKASL